MENYSKEAWDIANRYSDVLASETRDLAGWIDAALKEQSSQLRAEARQTLRDDFAKAALGGLIAIETALAPDMRCSPEELAEGSYRMADIMLKARLK